MDQWEKAITIELYDPLVIVRKETEDATGLIECSLPDTVDYSRGTSYTQELFWLEDRWPDLKISEIWANIVGDLLHFQLILTDGQKGFVRRYTYNGSYSVEWETGMGYE
jgi:hypothetical protein